MSKTTMDEFLTHSYLSGSNAEYVESLFEAYQLDPASVSEQWQQFFQQHRHAAPTESHRQIREQFKAMAKAPKQATIHAEVQPMQYAVNQLVDAYRSLGFMQAKLDPLGNQIFPNECQRLRMETYFLTSANLDEEFDAHGILPGRASLRDIIAQCERRYTGSLGFDCDRLTNCAEHDWLRQWIEYGNGTQAHAPEVREQALKKLVFTDSLERYLDKKYVAQKRFSIEGVDAAVPMIDRLINLAGAHQMKEVIVGMAHRGRVNVLLNNLGMSPQILYDDYQGPADYGDTSGDLKYHRGYSADVTAAGHQVHLSMLFNPSHLEYITPVIMGSVRARQSQEQGRDRKDYAMAIALHGDAAFSGEGVVMEALNMSLTRAHSVGGTIHIITNNQIGFTTRDLRDARSSLSCADAARIIDAPVIHVNADDIDACLTAVQLAFEYRSTFHKDIVIDLVGYRRHGHQEADEPSATAPLLYQAIKQHPRSATIYAQTLQQDKITESTQVEAWQKECGQLLDDAKPLMAAAHNGLECEYEKRWQSFVGKDWRIPYDDKASKKKLSALAEQCFTIPDGFNMQRQVGTVIKNRQAMAKGDKAMDWGFAELLSYVSLADAGISVRMVGQDCRRGTFSHRQSTWYDQVTGQEYCPFHHMFDDKAAVSIYDSELNESGVLGFEYGYSLSQPEELVIWEAQFGDFYNVAQVIVDQFISSGWQKWRRLSGIVMLLPHGYEGQGPEHTSGRLERFLQLCAQNNMQVAVPTTPAQMFHLMRRQVLRHYRRPLIVMTPKSLLRHPLAVSEYSDLTDNGFQLVIPEVDEVAVDAVERVIICSGKVYYDLLKARREREMRHIAIIRVEQLYPFPYDELTAELQRYPAVKDIVWCQEEPKNQGAWFVTRHRILRCMGANQMLNYVGREPFAAPSTGYIGLHKIQQQALVDQALDIAYQESEQPLSIND